MRTLTVARVRCLSRLLATVLVPCAIGCRAGDDPDDPGGTLLVEDSAGIEIVESARPVEGSRLGWRVGPEPAVTIGAVEGEDPYIFGWAIDVTRLSDGRIVVADYGSMELRVFDGTSGAHLATWGGMGEGPGEFESLTGVERLPGDSIIAWGWPLRIAVFDPDGNVVRGSLLERQAETTIGLRPVMPLSAMDDGSILASVDPIHIDTVVVELWDGEGNLRSPLGAHLAHEPRTWVEGMNRTQIFGWGLTLSPWGDLAVVTPSERYEIRAYAKDGTLARIVRMEHVPRSPTEAHVEAYVQEEAKEMIPDEMGEDLEQRRAEARDELRAVPVAERFPAFASVMSDRTGHLWIEEYEAAGEETEGVLWTVFDPAGHVLGFVETPEELEIFEIGEEYILGRVVDELWVNYVQLWTLERVGG